MTTEKPRRPRGFAAMSVEKRTALAKLGGAAVPAAKRSFAAQPGLAGTAGAKGGAASRRPARKPPADAT